jgi:hypothetical protein
MSPAHQVVVITYHKTGTVLFENVLSRISETLNLPMASLPGAVPFLPPAPPILLLLHGMLAALPLRDFRAIRVVRDPRDIWLSGYTYHRHCTEAWCVSTDFDETAPILFPRVPGAFHHHRERWKRDYLRGLGGRSYQRNLLDRDREAGLAFELERYTAATLEAMRAWPHRDPRILDLRLEDIVADFDAAMAGAFTHLGFPEHMLPDLLALAAPEDLNRMEAARLAANPHIHGRSLSKWRTGLSETQVTGFERRYGGLITALGYPLSDGARGAA